MSTPDSVAKPIAVCCGEPGGVGPDLCLRWIAARRETGARAAAVFFGDERVLRARAEALGAAAMIDFCASIAACAGVPTAIENPDFAGLGFCQIESGGEVVAGRVSPRAAGSTLAQTRLAAEGCLRGDFGALATAPISKESILRAGFDFVGQTEFLAEICGVDRAVMLLATTATKRPLRVALATTHLPLAQVAAAIDADGLLASLRVLRAGLRAHFLPESEPRIAVAALNPHAGEGGLLGGEEKEIIAPAVAAARAAGIDVRGPIPADTVYLRDDVDCVLAMFHDQALPVVKFADFAAINATLGLPFLRVSPDHGVAVDLAGGGGKLDPRSFFAAMTAAEQAAARRP